jgi:hypothetical protein
MTRFCPISGNAHPSQEGFCSSCGIALSKQLNVIDLDAIPSPIAVPLSSQDHAMHVLALPANKTVAGSAVLATNVRAQKGSIPSAGQSALSLRNSKAVTHVSYRTLVSLFTISYYFKSYQDEADDIRTYGAIHRESKFVFYCAIICLNLRYINL